MPLHRNVSGAHAQAKLGVRAQTGLPAEVGEVPKFRLGTQGMRPHVAYQIVHDELLLDGNERLNLATFVTTWMDRDADQLMAECASKNLIDKDEYPQTAELERRCVSILADLWHASETEEATGCSTTGSSEACMLGGLALKHRWRRRREAAGGAFDAGSSARPPRTATRGGLAEGGPNLVMGANVQVCWEKFCRYFDVEARLVPVGPPDGKTTHLTPETAVAHCDENTIGVVAILGSTYDGTYEHVAGIASALDTLAAETGVDVPIHVDAASGGFVVPFIDPDLEWDFRLPRVASINASGHKYGLVYPGIGWAVWRDSSALPEELVFKVDYLGGEMPTFSLNFSRPGSQVAAQYYNFLRLGFEGYQRVEQACRDNARWLAHHIADLGPFELVSRGDGIPALTFRLRDGVGYTAFDVSEVMRIRGWIMPAYRMPPGMEDVVVLRIVVRDDLSRELAATLLEDLRRVVERLEHRPDQPSEQLRTGFHH